ncbi:MAG: type II secretion system protein GspK [Oligoflexia bacterium]|nr:type II secretion system protein GspK [Oligoflexia bacterium]
MKVLRQKGGAVLLVILAVSSLILPLIQGVWLDTQLEYQFRRYHFNKLQARWNAHAGISLSLLRLYIFKGVEKSVPKQWESLVRPVLDQIWRFPFMWPLLPTEDMLESERESLQSLTKLSFLKGSYLISITAEDGLLDINDLSSPLPFLRDFTYDTLFNLLWNAAQEDLELKEEYDEKDIQEILNNLSDWTDLDSESQNGGSEELIEDGQYPLNRSFISVEEIKKTPQVTLKIFEILEPHITTYGSKSLNINYAKQEMLKALNFSPALIEQILLRTQIDSEFYQPFSGEKDFCDFVREQGFDWCGELKTAYQTLDMLSFDFPMSFRIKSNGEYRGQWVELEGLLYDLSSSAIRYQKAVYREQERQKNKGKAVSLRQNPSEDLQKDKKEQLKFDYSYYKSLVIMFLKESL